MLQSSYGQRACLACGNPFEALYANQVTCSDLCRGKRRVNLKRIADAGRRARRKERLAGLVARVAELEAEVERLKGAGAELAHVRAELDKAKQELARVMGERDEALAALHAARQSRPVKSAPESVEKIAEQAGLPPLQECARLKIKAVHLPCGEYDQCRKPTPCARLGADVVMGPGDRICPACKQVFTPNHPRRKYCSRECQENATRPQRSGKKK